MRKLIASLALAFVFSCLLSPATSDAAVHHGRTAQHVIKPTWVTVLRAGYRGSRTVEETEMVGGHLLHFMALSPAANASLPRAIDVASVDGGPYQAVAFTWPDTSMIIADANQNTGNFPGVISLSAGSSNIVITNGTSSNPTVDLATGITLSGACCTGTAISLSGTTTNKISSSGLTIGFDLVMPSGTPTDVLVVNPTTTPSGKLARLQNGGADEFTVDPTGNGVFTGNVTAVNGTLSGTLGVTGTSTLGATNTGAFTATTGSFSSTLGVTGAVTLSNLTASNCVGTNGTKVLVSNSNCVQSVAVTSPIGNSGTAQAPNFTCTTCVTTAGGQSIAGTTTVGQLIDSGLTASNCVGTNGSSQLASNSSCVQNLTAGSNVVSSGISGSTPTVAVTAAPTFSGALQAAGITNTANHTLSQAISTDSGTSTYLAFTAGDTGTTTFPTYTSTTDAAGTSFPGSGYPQAVVITPTAYSATNMVVGSIWQIDTGTLQENVVVTATNGTSTFTATFQESHANTGVTLKPIGIPVTVTPTVMEPGFVVGAVLAVDTGTSEELVNVTNVTGTTFKAVFDQNHGSTKTVTPVSIPDTITPVSMTGIVPGTMLTFDSNLSQEPIVVTSTVPGTSFNANFAKTHSGNHLTIVGAATTTCSDTAAPCTYATLNTANNGGMTLTAPSIQGSNNQQQGILQIVVPQNGQSPINDPMDVALLGGQNGDQTKTAHTFFINCNTQPQDCLMFLLGGDTSGGTNQKCVTWNTASALPQQVEPSIMVLKCRGDLSILGGNFTANSSQNGQGGIGLGGTNTVAGAIGNGAIDMSGLGIIATNGVCAMTSSNASPSLATPPPSPTTDCNVTAQITSGSATATLFKITTTTFNTNGLCFAGLAAGTVGSIPTCNEVSATETDVTFATAPTTTGKINVFWVGGK